MFTETVECVNGGLARLLEAVRAGDLPAARLKDLIAVSRSWEAKVAALQTDAARLISAREGHGDGGASVLRDQVGKSRSQARRSLGAAEALDEMPGLRGAVDSGEVSLANAERLADAAKRTAPEAVDSASDLMTMAKEMPPDRFAREVGAWTQRHQSDHGHQDYLNKRRRRYLKTWKQQDGMVRLDGLLDPETGTRICNRLQDAAEELRRQDQKSARRGAAAAASEGPAAAKLTTSSPTPDYGAPTSKTSCSSAGAATTTSTTTTGKSPTATANPPSNLPTPKPRPIPPTARSEPSDRSPGSRHARPGGGTGAKFLPPRGKNRARDRTRRPDEATAKRDHGVIRTASRKTQPLELSQTDGEVVVGCLHPRLQPGPVLGQDVVAVGGLGQVGGLERVPV